MDKENTVSQARFLTRTYSLLVNHYSLLIKVIVASAILHFLFIYYFPLDFLDRLFYHETSLEKKTVRAQDTMHVFFPPDSAKPKIADRQPEDSIDNNSKETSEEGIPGNIDQAKWGDLLERLKDNTGFQGGFVQTYEGFTANNKVSNSYIFRDRMHEDIVIKEVFPTIHDIDKPFQEVLTDAKQKLSDHTERNRIIDEFRDPLSVNESRLKIQIEPKSEMENQGALHFPPDERQKYFDETLAENKTKQLGDFIKKFHKYDPNVGDLPIATRELYYQNLERLLYSFSTDSTYFYLDFYLENLNKEDFLFNALNEASRLDGSKTVTELLFILQELYEIQQRAWQVYFDFKKANDKTPPAKRNRLRFETLRRVDERYKPVLESKNIQNINDIHKRYFKRRLEISEYILNNTPKAYRVHDAKFTQASILWEMGSVENSQAKINKSLDIWKSLLKQVKQNPLSNTEKSEFLNLPILSNLEKLLISYENSPENLRPTHAKNITAMLKRREPGRIERKRERENRILWR